jgi:5-(carboxyamino)imidazole ribonucleotide synthase
MITPGSRIGILGGGQLGRMMAIAARRLGYGVIGLDPDPACPLAAVADEMVVAAYGEAAAVAHLAARVAVLTVEFENVPAESLAAAQGRTRLAPGPQVLHAARHRLREKDLARHAGLTTTAYAAIHGPEDLDAALAVTGLPAILKTCELGYDGKGQRLLRSRDEAHAALSVLRPLPLIAEAVVPFRAECSVIIHRSPSGACAIHPVFENRHHRHILDVTLVPAALASATVAAAETGIRALAAALDLHGTLCAEFFVVGSGADERLVFNEMAPRPHNSGHVTIDASRCCQFENHIRAITDLPLGDTSLLLGGGAMVNLLGEVWASGEPDWANALTNAAIKVHLYGKGEPRSGRKMGHLNLAAADPAEAAKRLIAAREALRASP